MSLDRNNQEEIQQALARYRKTGDPVVRAQLVDAFLLLTRSTAKRIVGENVAMMDMDIDDLASVGAIGLLNAIESYEPRKEAKFETYCVTRIRFAIIDSLRTYETSSKLNRVSGSGRRGRPTREDNTDEPFRRKLSLDTSRTSAEGDSWQHSIADRKQTDPLIQLSMAEVKEFITDQCNEIERLIVVLYYYENMTLKNIGDVVELTEGRVSQLHKSLLARLRKRFGERQHDMFCFQQ